jgi:hypothetical protein
MQDKKKRTPSSMCLRVCGGGMPPSTEKDTQKYVEKNIFFIHS